VLGRAIRHPGGPGVSGGRGPVSRAGLREGRPTGGRARETIGHSRGLGLLTLARFVKCRVVRGIELWPAVSAAGHWDPGLLLLLMVGSHEGVLLLDVHLLQHLPRVVHAAPGHPRGMGGHWRPLTMMDHHHGGVHVRGLEIDLRLLEKIETGGFLHWGDGLLLNLLLLGVMLLLLNLLWDFLLHIRLLLLRGAGEYWHGFLGLLLLRVIVAKHVIGLVNTAVAVSHLRLDDRLGGWHRVLILILSVLSVLSVVILLGAHVGLGVGGGVLGPLGLDVARLADQVDQSVEILVGAAGDGAGLLVGEAGEVLRTDVDLLVEAALLLDLPVRRDEGRELDQLLHLVLRQLGRALRAGLEVGDDGLLLERGQDLLHSQDISHLGDVLLGPFQQLLLGLLLLVPDLILGELRKLSHKLLRELESSDNLFIFIHSRLLVFVESLSLPQSVAVSIKLPLSLLQIPDFLLDNRYGSLYRGLLDQGSPIFLGLDANRRHDQASRNTLLDD